MSAGDAPGGDAPSPERKAPPRSGPRRRRFYGFAARLARVPELAALLPAQEWTRTRID